MEPLATRTNLERALSARDLAASALNGSRYMALEDYEAGLLEALANLMHFARRYEIDFEQALEEARTRHSAEQRFAWEAVPE